MSDNDEKLKDEKLTASNNAALCPMCGKLKPCLCSKGGGGGGDDDDETKSSQQSLSDVTNTFQTRPEPQATKKDQQPEQEELIEDDESNSIFRP